MPSVPHISRTQFVDLYAGAKRAVYARAVETLEASGLKRSHAYLSSFVKVEKTNFTTKVDPCPRLIQPRHPCYNVELGRYLKLAEHATYRAIDSVFGEITVMKHHNADDSGQIVHQKWKKFDNPVAFSMDAKRFDQHTHASTLRYEHQHWLRLFGNDPYLAQLLSWQIHNRGFINCQDGRIKYRVEGRRCSGDMNTGSGNVYIMCSMVYAFMVHSRVRMSVLNNGDDCVVIMERKDMRVMEGAKAFFLRFGYTMEVENPVFRIEHIDFCQTRPIRVGDTYRMVRDPRVTIDKDDVCIKGVQSAEEWDAQRGAVAACGLALAGDIPVVNEYYRMLGNGAQLRRADRPSSGMEWLALGMDLKYAAPDPLTRLSFYVAFDITPDEQVAMEKSFATTHPSFQQLAPKGYTAIKRNNNPYRFTKPLRHLKQVNYN